MTALNPASAPRAADESRRNPASKDAILTATFEVLQQQGFRHLTIEGVAARAGVGKATIYRWWPGKGALAVEAVLLNVSPAIEYDPHLGAREAIGQQMRRLARAYAGPTGRIVREMLATGQLEPETLGLFIDGYLEPRRAAARVVLHRGIEQGELRADFDMEAAIDAMYGPIHHRSLLGGDPADEGFLAFVHSAVFDHIADRSRPNHEAPIESGAR